MRILWIFIYSLVSQQSLLAGIMDVTISGELPLNLKVTELKADSGRPSLTLVHRLVNVGSRYVSLVQFAELNSKLIRISENEYFWQNPYGRSTYCLAGKSFSEGSNTWILTENKETCTLTSLKTDMVLTYKEGRLSTCSERNGVVRISYLNGMASTIELRGGRATATYEWQTKGSGIVAYRDGSVVVTYTTWGSINTCTVCEGNAVKQYSFSYDNRYLSRVETPTEAEPIVITEKTWGNNFINNSVSHPVVTRIANTAISYERNWNSIHGRMTDLATSQEVAHWTAQIGPQGVSLRSFAGNAKHVLSDGDEYTSY